MLLTEARQTGAGFADGSADFVGAADGEVEAEGWLEDKFVEVSGNGVGECGVCVTDADWQEVSVRQQKIIVLKNNVFMGIPHFKACLLLTLFPRSNEQVRA